MAGRDLILRSEPGFSLPAFERIAPPPPPESLAAHIDATTAPGDLVLDLNSRGGWIARAALDRQRRAIVLESNPLTRLLAEVVLRPPDVRHLDAAFQAIAAAPRQQSSLKVWISDAFATRCPGCERTVVADEFVWETSSATPVRKHYHCLTCRDQVGGGEQRHAVADESDVARAGTVEPHGTAWRTMRDRFPTLDGNEALVDQILELHTPRQLTGLQAILERIDTDLRAAPVEAALRLALLHAILPASRLNGYPGRVASVRIANGRLRQPTSAQWRERNPWLAFEDGFRLVRGFVQRLEGGAPGPVQARFGDDVRSLGEGVATAVVRIGTPSTLRALSAEGGALQRLPGTPRVALVLGQPPLRPNQERLSYTYLATGWVLGREAASLLPLEPLFGAPGQVPWSWQAVALRRGLSVAVPLLNRDCRIVLLVEPRGPAAVVAAVLGGVAAGYRLVSVRLAEGGDEVGGTVELVPPGARLPGGPRTRANVPLQPVPGGPSDPDLVAGRGILSPPERFDARPVSLTEIGRTVTETAVAVLRARGEPATYDQLLGEILVGLDRAGQLRRLVSARRDDDPGGEAAADEPGDGRGAGESGADGPPRPEARHDPASGQATGPLGPGSGGAGAGGLGRGSAEGRREGVLEAARRRAREPLVLPEDPVDALVALVRDEIARPDHRRLEEIEPGRWWLASREDRTAAAAPLADRVEWAVFSLLSTAGELSEAGFFERIGHLFNGYDQPDEGVVRACLESYRSRASTADALQAADDLVARSTEHGEVIASLADLGHRMGMSVWISRREQERRVRGRPLAEWLDDREQRVYLPLVTRAPAEDLEQVDCIWYVRGRAVVLFEVEWTAMLAEPILRRHARIPTTPETIRFLVLAPERTELARAKIERSPLLRTALEEGNWHVLKWNHLRAFAGRDAPSLGDLEPYLGLDPAAERSGDQLPLFD